MQQQALRAARYVNIEGSAELGWGTALLCWSVAGYGTILLRPKSLWVHAILWLFFLGGALAPLLLPRLIKRFITWPRTGYVAYLHDAKFWTGIVISIVIAGVIGVMIPRLLRPEMQQAITEQLHRISPSAVPPARQAAQSKWGGVMLILFLVSNPILYLMMNAVSMKQHAWKWILLAVMALGSCGISFAARGNFFEGMRPLSLFIGLMWFTSGAGTLCSYLRANRVGAELP